MERRKALGRGLQALISEPGDIQQKQGEALMYLNIEQLAPNKFQPRGHFDQEKLNELISSIKEKGVVQPVLARRTDQGFELIAGERRLRAMRALGLEKVPAIIKEADDLEAIQLALIENIQREGLNPVEEASAFKRLIEEFGFTQEKIAQTVGRDRTTITNTIRVLGLPLEIQRHIIQGRIGIGHAKAILSVKGLQQQLNLCNKIIEKGLTTREAELLANPKAHRRPSGKFAKDAHLVALEETLQHALGTKVRINHGKKSGRIVVEYYSLDDLDRIINIIKRKQIVV